MVPIVGVQLYTLRRECARDFLGVLRAVRELGYPAVEGFWGLFGATTAAVRRELDQLGLAMPSAHVPLETLENGLEEAVELWGGLGCGTLVCPWVDEPTRSGAGAWERLGDRLDRIGGRLRSQGLALAYHNHDFELAGQRAEAGSAPPLAGQGAAAGSAPTQSPDGLERLLSRCAPEHLSLELDVFWLDHAGRDPARYLREHGDRVRLVHLKDGRHRPLAFTPLGDGEVDLEAVIDAASDLPRLDALLVEQDECDGDALEALRRSAAKLVELGLLTTERGV